MRLLILLSIFHHGLHAGISVQSFFELQRAMFRKTAYLPDSPTPINLDKERYAISFTGLADTTKMIDELRKNPEFQPSKEMLSSFLTAYVVAKGIRNNPVTTLNAEAQPDNPDLRRVIDYGVETRVMYSTSRDELSGVYFPLSGGRVLHVVKLDDIINTYGSLVEDDLGHLLRTLAAVQAAPIFVTDGYTRKTREQRYPLNFYVLNLAKEVIENSSNNLFKPNEDQLKSFLTAYIVAKKINDKDPTVLDRAQNVVDNGNQTIVKYHPSTRTLATPSVENPLSIKIDDIMNVYATMIKNAQDARQEKLVLAQPVPETLKGLMKPGATYLSKPLKGGLEFTPPSTSGDTNLTPAQLKDLKHIAIFGLQFDDNKHSDKPQLEYMKVIGSDDVTPSGMSFGFDSELLLRKTIDWIDKTANPFLRPGFEYLWATVAAYIPTRRLTSDTPPLLRPWTPEEMAQYIDPYSHYDEVNRALKQYTENKNYVYSVLNFALSAHATTALPVLIPAIRNLRNAIIHQQEKYRGIVYRGSVASASEVFWMIHKGTFYLPSFISTSTEESSAYWEPIDFSTNEMRGRHNVMYVIDTREFPDYSTLIKDHQSNYEEKENLLACYNLYEFQRYEYSAEDGKFRVYLKLKDPTEHQPKIDQVLERAISRWVTKHSGENNRTRQVQPALLANLTRLMHESYLRLRKELSL